MQSLRRGFKSARLNSADQILQIFSSDFVTCADIA
jgi:hypothetical protein